MTSKLFIPRKNWVNSLRGDIASIVELPAKAKSHIMAMIESGLRDELANYLAIERWANSLVTSSGTFVTVDHGGQETVQTTAASGATFTVDVTQANVFDITLTANCTFTISGATAGKGDSITLILRQDATGSRSVTWPASVLWVGGTAPVLSANPHQVDLITMVTVDGGTTWFTFVAGLNLH